MTESLTQQARVVAEHKTKYILRNDQGELNATVRGTFHLDEDFPKVGDFVEYTKTVDDQAVIEKILPRKTQIARDIADERKRHSAVQKSQVIVTNVDYIFIVMGLDGDFNVSRLERYLIVARESNIKPVIVLNKVDTIEDKEIYFSQVVSLVDNVPIHFVSALKEEGMEMLRAYFKNNMTVVLLGSSGAGKSTITNWLLQQEKQLVGGVREDDSRGRHTTTHRELFDVPGGGYLIDTPGIRSLGMLSVSEMKDNMFDDIEALMLQCRYPDCDHVKSEGCAVQEAIKEGTLTEDHLDKYWKYKKEQEYISAKVNTESYLERKHKVRRMHKEYKKIQNEKYDERGFR